MFGLASRKVHPRVPRRHGEGGKSHLTSFEGLAALSLDALSSVAYGPEAIVVVLVVAGTGAIKTASNGDTQRLIPLYSIGVFIGFTISQIGLVKHWTRQRPGGWVPRTVLNATGAVLTGIAAAVLLATKFVAGAWIVVITVPLLMVLFTRIKRYYAAVGAEISRGRIPATPSAADSLVIVPLGKVDKVAERAIAAAKSLGDEVVVLAVFAQQSAADAMRTAWDQWNPGVRLEIVESPQHSLVGPVVDYVERANRDGRQVAVLIPQVEPQHQRYRILQNQRGITGRGPAS